MPKKSCLREPFNKQHDKRAKTPLKSASQHLDHINWSLTRKLSQKKSLFLTWKVFGLLVNTLAAEEIYPVLNRDNLMKPIQIQLSQKEKTFSLIFAAFLKSSSNFERFEEKVWPPYLLYFQNYGLGKRG